MSLKQLHDMQRGVCLYHLSLASFFKHKEVSSPPTALRFLMCIMNPGEKEWGGLGSDLLFDISSGVQNNSFIETKCYSR